MMPQCLSDAICVGEAEAERLPGLLPSVVRNAMVCRKARVRQACALRSHERGLSRVRLR